MAKTSLIGALGRSPLSLMAWKTGVSSSLSRIHRPKATRTAEIRNATRQPQLRNASSVSAAARTASTPLASRLPAGGPIWAAEAQKPRLAGSPYSLDSSTAPPHSPPTPTPCAKRSMTRMIGAATPIEA